MKNYIDVKIPAGRRINLEMLNRLYGTSALVFYPIRSASILKKGCFWRNRLGVTFDK